MSDAFPAEDSGQPGMGEIYERLHADILACVMAPGAQFRERQIAERFNVSKSPVRDALIKLQEQNLVEVIPRKGYRVTRISLTDARDLYEMRVILEREAIARLVESGSDEDLASLDQHRDGSIDSLDEWIGYNRGFHVHLAMICGNQRLARAGREVVEQFDRLTKVSVSNAVKPDILAASVLEDRMEEHRAIIDAIQARDKRKAVSLSREHIEASRRRLMAALESASIAL
jgi:GntR family transcriptional regulator, rspAB operon transcriptional repressor